MAFQHILVALDFSALGEQALNTAMELAQTLQARLTLVHIVELPVTTDIDIAAYLAKMEASSRREMGTYQKRVADAGLAAEVIIARGIPYKDIVDIAKDKHVDLIIMGSHGRTGFQHLMLGSVAERVLRLAPCPVMVIRETQD